MAGDRAAADLRTARGRSALSGGPTRSSGMLSIGMYATESWKHSSFGTKIMKAVDPRKSGRADRDRVGAVLAWSVVSDRCKRKAHVIHYRSCVSVNQSTGNLSDKHPLQSQLTRLDYQPTPDARSTTCTTRSYPFY
jgi:hypothetical protein